MKTNHQREFVDEGSFRDPSMTVISKRLQEGMANAKSIGNDFCNGHHGAARAKAGAKKYCRVQERIEGKGIVNREIQALDTQD